VRFREVASKLEQLSDQHFNRLSFWDPFLMIYLWLQACSKEGHVCGRAWACICNF
jgi:hypothetical protein